MSQTLVKLGIDQFSVAERIALIQEIWDSVAAEIPPPQLTEAQQQELRKRAAEHQATPDDIVPWEEIKAAALERFTK